MPRSKGRSSPQRRKGPTSKRRLKAGVGLQTTSSPHPGAGTSPEAPHAQASPSARYTPKFKSRGPFRPTWHKVTGALVILFGVAIFVLNDLDNGVLPGAHNELYAIVAIGIAASSLWWFGAFDRPPERR